jgi:hypothetical protein
MSRTLAAAFAALACQTAHGGEAKFAERPRVKKDGAKTTVSFAVAGPTDVAVSVLDAEGKVVRHLAAGVLSDAEGSEAGETNPPPPPLKPGLAQTIAWDGKDDYGNPAGNGPFRIRVALGLKPEFAGFLLYHPDALPDTYRVAVGPGGDLYYFYQDPTCNYNMGGHKVKVRSRDGRHVCTLVPFPADLRPDEFGTYGALADDDGCLVPRIHNYETFSVQPTTTGARRRDTSCYTPMVDSKGRLYWIVRDDRLVCVDAEGRCPYPSYLSEPLFPGAEYSPWSHYDRYLALSSGENHVYVSAFHGSTTTEPATIAPSWDGCRLSLVNCGRSM